MSDVKLWARAQASIHTFGVDVVFMGEGPTGRRTVVKEVIFEDVENFGSVAPVAISLDEAAASQLMKDLWVSGIRPPQDVMGETDKTDIRAHLADMRSIVFNGLSMKVDIEKKTE